MFSKGFSVQSVDFQVQVDFDKFLILRFQGALAVVVIALFEPMQNNIVLCGFSLLLWLTFCTGGP
jgi:hypothetical protein